MIPHLSVFTSRMVSLTGQHFSSTRYTNSKWFYFSFPNPKELVLTKLLFIQATMEEVFLRFPHLAESFFDKLDNQNLSKCLEVGRSWKSFIDSAYLMWIRIKRKYPLQNEDKARFTTIKNCGNYKTQHYCTTDLHLAALTGQTEIFKILFEEQFRYKNNLEKRWKGYEVTPFI